MNALLYNDYVQDFERQKYVKIVNIFYYIGGKLNYYP